MKTLYRSKAQLDKIWAPGSRTTLYTINGCTHYVEKAKWHVVWNSGGNMSKRCVVTDLKYWGLIMGVGGFEWELEGFHWSKGMINQYSIAYLPQQNGVAECTNRTLLEKTRVMLLQVQLPVTFWPSAIRYATSLLNRTYTPALKRVITPFKAWNGRKPSLKCSHTFCGMAIGYVLKP